MNELIIMGYLQLLMLGIIALTLNSIEKKIK